MAQAVVPIGPDVSIGDPQQFTVIAGPCSIESFEQLSRAAEAVKAEGGRALRGGMFKLRTNPNTFQGMGDSAFEIVRAVKAATGLLFISEITDPRQIPDFLELVDVFQVGSRNMYNYALLKELGLCNKPVLLKRGFSALIEEWLQAAEYVTAPGKAQVILCERGIRTFENKTRNTLDLNAVAYLKKHTSYPVIVDPSHGTGRSELVGAMAKAAAAAGADGLMIEIHPDPKVAKSDSFQALTLPEFSQLMAELRTLLPILGRRLARG